MGKVFVGKREGVRSGEGESCLGSERDVMFLLAWEANSNLTDRVDHQETGRCEREDASGGGVGKAIEAHELAIAVINLIIGAL